MYIFFFRFMRSDHLSKHVKTHSQNEKQDDSECNDDEGKVDTWKKLFENKSTQRFLNCILSVLTAPAIQVVF